MIVKWTLVRGLVRLFVLSCGHVITAPDRPQRASDPDYARCPHCEVEQ